MAIKKRTRVVDPAALEAFAAAADNVPEATDDVGPSALDTDSPAPGAASKSGARDHAPKPVVATWPADVAKTLLIRWPSPKLATELHEMAAVLDRSQHKTALIALELGLQMLRQQTEKE